MCVISITRVDGVHTPRVLRVDGHTCVMCAACRWTMRVDAHTCKADTCVISVTHVNGHACQSQHMCGAGMRVVSVTCAKTSTHVISVIWVKNPGLVYVMGLAHVTDLACLAERDDLKDKHAYLVVQMVLSEVQINFSSISYLLCLCNIFLFLLLLYK